MPPASGPGGRPFRRAWPRRSRPRQGRSGPRSGAASVPRRASPSGGAPGRPQCSSCPPARSTGARSA
eukprot:5620408-Lingulodinium_polyedra.AAC.1